ncbi:hypothetical protein R1T40_03430 [Tritonibacter scottomollicae]|uniref:Uncharacterized protein n=2 Tax=Tritonibacter scottomollicae TaxID=483013 RepID=A0ABZ0HHW5_TRISK|nr:hypothetical protein [Tritonibacter scottomollicae]WOI33813.1 hypothetical protein R1T40_03430 [Tritonibacter scottomollicae]
MYKFYSASGVIGLSRYEDGRDLPERFNDGSRETIPSGGWSSEEWLATMLTQLVEEENMNLEQLMSHLATMGVADDRG